MWPALIWFVLVAPLGITDAVRGDDCNGNGVPDDQDLVVDQASAELSPIGHGFPQSYTLSQPPIAGSDVTLTFAAVADFGAAGFEYVDIDINGTWVGRVFDAGAHQCPATPDVDVLVVAAADYNAAAAGGDAVITMTASVDVDAGACTNSSIIVTVAYGGRDCNVNGIPDECEPDCNENGVPDDCDIDPDDPDVDGRVFDDCDINGVPDVCEALIEVDGDNIAGACDNCPRHTNPDQADCDNDGIGDVCAIADGLARDCDGNGLPDACDIALCDPNDPTCKDCNANGIPDECELDCNANGMPDDCDTTLCDPNDPACQDCDGNGVPDSCDVAAGTHPDCNANGVPDTCEADCNENGVPDDCDIASAFSRDCDANGVPDDCDIANDPSLDCDDNGGFDACDIADGVAFDCNTNGVPDACDVDFGASPDCNGNEIPDECDIESGLSGDCNDDGVLDLCELVLCNPNDPACADCNANGVPDGCEPDCNTDGVLDECEIAACDPLDPICQDCDGNRVPDGCDPDCDGDQLPDACEINQGSATDANGNGVPDECEDEIASFAGVASDGVLGDPGNVVLTHDFFGGFTLGRIDWIGSLTILEPQTLGGEAQVQITHPSGVTRGFQLNSMSQTIGGGPTYAESGAIPQQTSPIARPFGLGLDPAGVWTFRFFETVDDGAPGAADARWETLEFSLTSDSPSQPTPPAAQALDIGSGSATAVGALGAGEVKWFRIETARAAAASRGTHLDLDTFGSLLISDNDTELAIYDAWGYLLASNDDAPGTLLSLISLGTGAGGDATGQHGDAFAGVYYVALGAYNTSFADGFTASSTSPYTGAWQLNVTTNALGGGGLFGDVNGDCLVNITDLAILLVNFGTTTGAAFGDGDLTGDGAVNISDLSIVLVGFGAICP
jgi:hypothetical protein